jgi:hypothetical protein
MVNFRKPYFANSISDFWRRWHISLSTWLKDYIYIPLGGNRKGKFRQKINLMLTFIISGLWHGAAWHFVLWGALHGAFQCLERIFEENFQKFGERQDKAISHFVCIAVTFILVCYAWIFFRAKDIETAFLINRKLFLLPKEIFTYIANISHAGIIGTIRSAFSLGKAPNQPIDGYGLTAGFYAVISIFVLVACDFLCRKESGLVKIMRLPMALRWILYYVLIIAIILNWSVSKSEFIYFMF